ncbi:hypothetical protein QWJ90_05815 [Microbacterium oryzae]|uniref:hypothetical protein n=1 Tax=Microbacterium oryzae TaxID=743009 RepID=UPI0025B11CD6|nr:hypothetical protein [Microbacterium oryzae]MDN3310438.1 hypothetical protein [Microbacterium oryzae]
MRAAVSAAAKPATAAVGVGEAGVSLVPRVTLQSLVAAGMSRVTGTRWAEFSHRS